MCFMCVFRSRPRLQVTRLCDLSADSNTVTSVSWNERGNQVAVGTHLGYVTVWDVTANKQVSIMKECFKFSLDIARFFIVVGIG